MRSRNLASALLVAVPVALLCGALAFQYIGGIYPCEMCMWQRWVLVASLAIAIVAVLAGRSRVLLALSALVVLGGAGVAMFHVGVEQHWWQGITACAVPPVAGTTAEMMSQIMAQPLIRCDAIAWSLFGISMAGWNALISTITGGLALWLLRRG